MSVIITDDESDEPEDIEDALEDVAEAAEDMADAVHDAVMDETTIALVERVTQIETLLAVYVGPMIEGLGQRIQELEWRTEMAQDDANRANQAVAEVAEEAAEAIQETVEDIDEASEEITADEVPTTREHRFFRKWGSK